MSQFYSTILKFLIQPAADLIMNTSISYFYRRIKDMHTWSKEDIKYWQNKKLCSLIEHAYNHTNYYRNLFETLKLTPSDIRTVDDLKKLPILTKEDILKNYSNLIPNNLNTIPHKKTATGGSTGVPLIYLSDNMSWSYSNANNILSWEDIGYKYGDAYIALGSTSLFANIRKSLKHYIYYRLKNKIGINGVNMSDKVCSSILNIIISKRIRYIYGYASAIYLLGKYVVDNNISLNVLGCFTTSEVLIPHYRETIHLAFKCRIVDCYGAHDGGITAYSIEPGLFKVGYNCYVRLHQPDSINSGSALLTDLLNYAMPLINYQLGDILQMKEDDLVYNGQVVNHVVGRESDILQFGNGNILTGPGFTVLFSDLPVEYYCIEKLTDFSIKCHIIKLDDYSSESEKLILQTIKKQAGIGIDVKITYTTKPFLSKSGKRKYFVDSSCL